MADTRKHRITIRDELDAQLIAQLGEEPVRPYEAGELHGRDGAPTPPEAPPARTGVVGSFTFGARPAASGR